MFKKFLTMFLVIIMLVQFIIPVTQAKITGTIDTETDAESINKKDNDIATEDFTFDETVASTTMEAFEVWDGSVADSFDGGTGTISDPYQIANGEQLAYLAQEVNSGNSYSKEYFVLTRSIRLNDTTNSSKWETSAPKNEWIPIGTANNPFSGDFNGNNNTVFGVYINQPSASCQGLFGVASAISNLRVTHSYICGQKCVGIIGSCDIVQNVHSNFTIIKAYSYVGGIVGSSSNVTKCSNRSGKVLIISYGNNNSACGGIVGYFTNGKTAAITECYNASTVDSQGSANVSVLMGGIVGASSNSGEKKISNCYNYGTIGHYGYPNGIGGIIGDGTAVLVERSYNAGKISGYGSVAGIMAIAYNSSSAGYGLKYCYNLGDVSAKYYKGSLISTYPGNRNVNISNCDNTITQSNMIYPLSYVGFDFVDTWFIDINSDYHLPQLSNNCAKQDKIDLVTNTVLNSHKLNGVIDTDEYLVLSVESEYYDVSDVTIESNNSAGVEVDQSVFVLNYQKDGDVIKSTASIKLRLKAEGYALITATLPNGKTAMVEVYIYKTKILLGADAYSINENATYYVGRDGKLLTIVQSPDYSVDDISYEFKDPSLIKVVSSENGSDEYVPDDSEYESCSTLVLEGLAEGETVMTVSTPDGANAEIKITVKKPEFKITLYSYLPALVVSEGSDMRCGAALTDGDCIIRDNVSFSVVSSNADIIYIDKIEHVRDGVLFSINGGITGSANIIITELSTNTVLSATIAVKHNTEIFNSAALPNYYDHEYEFNGYIGGMYIDNFLSEITENANCYKVSFNVYNTSSVAGLVTVYYADGNIKECRIIDRFDGDWTTDLSDVFFSVRDLYKDVTSGDVLTYKQRSYSECTKVDELYVPKGGHIEITNDISQSNLCGAFNLVEWIINNILTVINVAKMKGLNDKEVKAIAHTSAKEFFLQVLKNPDNAKLFCDKFLDKIGEEATSSAVMSLIEYTFTDGVEVFQMFDVDMDALIFDAAIEAGIGGLESVFTTATSDFIGGYLTEFFALNKILGAVDYTIGIIQSIGKGAIDIYFNSDNAYIYDGDVRVCSADGSSGIVSENFVVHSFVLSSDELTENEINAIESISHEYTVNEICLERDGEISQPGQRVQVTVPIPRGYDPKKTCIYWMHDDGTLEKLVSNEDGYSIQFFTDHFSKYVIMNGVEPLSVSNVNHTLRFDMYDTFNETPAGAFLISVSEGEHIITGDEITLPFGFDLADDFRVYINMNSNGEADCSTRTINVVRSVMQHGEIYKVISTGAGLKKISNDMRGNYILSADLHDVDINTPFGYDNENSSIIPFTGIFDGNDHVIDGIDLDEEDYVGLFAQNYGTIKNLILQNVDIRGNGFVGAIVAENLGEIIHCLVSAGSIEGEDRVGAIAGYNREYIAYCSTLSSNTDSHLSGNFKCGGIAGCNTGTIQYCTTSIRLLLVSESSEPEQFGGIAGFNNGTVSYSYCSGSVVLNDDGDNDTYGVGGLIGYNAGRLTDCAFVGECVKGYKYVGGLVGYDKYGKIMRCYVGQTDIYCDSTYGAYDVGYFAGTNSCKSVYAFGNILNGSNSTTVSDYDELLSLATAWDWNTVWDNNETPFKLRKRYDTYSVKYNVSFYGPDKCLIESQNVIEGYSAIAPMPAIKEGCIFTGWDKDFTNVTGDMTITAQYATKIYTVKFKDGLTGETISTATVEHGTDAVFPTPPEHDGYTFTGWDSDGKNIKSDTVITALYEENTSVILGDVNGDGVINGKDVTLIRRYITGGYDVEVIFEAADINGDGVINGKDITLLRRLIVGGYGDVA